MNYPETLKSFLTKQKPQIEELREIAVMAVPQDLAENFAIACDSGACYVNPEAAVFPKNWPYTMRCVEFYTPAREWIEEVLALVGEDNATAFTNAVKLVAIASEEVDLDGEDDP